MNKASVSRKLQVKHDISIPDDFKDVGRGITPKKIEVFFKYITSDNICPLAPQNYPDLFPSTLTTVSVQSSFQQLITIDHKLLHSIPNFVVSYCLILLKSSILTSDLISLIKFLGKFILDDIQISETLLAIVIPYTFHVYENQKSLYTSFFNQLTDRFTQPIVFNYYLPYAKACKKIAATDFINSLLRKNAIDQQVIDDIIKLSTEMNKGDENKSSWGLLNKSAIKYKDSLTKKNSSKSIKGIAPSLSSVSESSRIQVTAEMLDLLVSQVEDGQANDSILLDIQRHISQLKTFPNHSLEPVFIEVLRRMSDNQEGSIYNSMFSIIRDLNMICNPREIFHIYQNSIIDLKNNGIRSDIIEQCYQHFLTYAKGKNTGIDLPNTLTAMQDLEVRQDIELAFNCLASWESSYDGVVRIYSILKMEPETDIFIYFDSISDAKKAFVVQGLYQLCKEEDNTELLPIVKDLESYTYGESNRDRINRQVNEFNSKLDDIISNSPQNSVNKSTPLSQGTKSILKTPTGANPVAGKLVFGKQEDQDKSRDNRYASTKFGSGSSSSSKSPMTTYNPGQRTNETPKEINFSKREIKFDDSPRATKSTSYYEKSPDRKFYNPAPSSQRIGSRTSSSSRKSENPF